MGRLGLIAGLTCWAGAWSGVCLAQAPAEADEPRAPVAEPAQGTGAEPEPALIPPAEATTAEPATEPTAAEPPTEPGFEDETGELAGLPPLKEPPLTRVRWDDRWQTAGLWDALIVGSGAVVVIADSQIEWGADSSRWSRPILWDESVRDALRFSVAGDRETAGTISDLMMLGSLIHSILFDNLVVAWAIHGQRKLAWQMSVMNAEAYAIALSLTSLTKVATSRARPLVEECEQDPEYSSDCQALDRYRSFFSGHSAVTAVGAGLLCAHHLNVPLYDGGLLDVGTCAMGIGLTLATGAMRIASDNHWATDVTTGHLVGFASGLLVPTLLYYTGDSEPEPSSGGVVPRARVLPSAGPDHLGVQLLGSLP